MPTHTTSHDYIVMRADSRPLLCLFAREPVAGSAKTRLIPALGAQAAARLAEAMIELTIDNARRYWPGPVQLMVWPPEARSRMMRRHDVPVVAQQGADLGARMMAALNRADGGPCAVVGCDVPHAGAQIFRRAAEQLVASQNVIGPACDGGFYLVGLAHPVQSLFDDIEWGTNEVLRRVYDNARELGLSLTELPTLRDIDTPEDLAAIARIHPPLSAWLEPLREAGYG